MERWRSCVMLRCAITVCSPIISFHLCSLEACFMLTRPKAKTFQSLLCVELVCILVFFMLACLFHLTWLAFREKQRKIFSTCNFKWQVISCASASAQTSQISCEVLVIWSDQTKALPALRLFIMVLFPLRHSSQCLPYLNHT